MLTGWCYLWIRTRERSIIRLMGASVWWCTVDCSNGHFLNQSILPGNFINGVLSPLLTDMLQGFWLQACIKMEWSPARLWWSSGLRPSGPRSLQSTSFWREQTKVVESWRTCFIWQQNRYLLRFLKFGQSFEVTNVMRRAKTEGFDPIFGFVDFFIDDYEEQLLMALERSSLTISTRFPNNGRMGREWRVKLWIWLSNSALLIINPAWRSVMISPR